MKIISIVNQKGGVAKTTTTRNVAYVLATKFNKRVLLIDMDDSANLSESFGLILTPPIDRPNLVGVAKLLNDKQCGVEEVIFPTPYSNIDIIPCNEGLSQARVQIETDAVSLMQLRLKKKLAPLRQADAYDFCLIDTKAGLDALVVNGMAASDEVIIPSTADRDSFALVDRAIRAIEDVSDYSPVALRGVVLTMVNTRTSLDRQTITDLMQDKPYPVFDTYIRQSAAVKQASWQYKMCDEDNPGSPSAIDYDNLVCELLGEPYLHENGASRKAFIAAYREKQISKKQRVQG